MSKKVKVEDNRPFWAEHYTPEEWVAYKKFQRMFHKHFTEESVYEEDLEMINTGEGFG